MDGFPIDVEVSISQGLPSFAVVGLPDASIQESRERVRAAVQASGETWSQQRITVNLSPAHLPKTGSGFDLAIALALLCASGRIHAERLSEFCAVGELSLNGSVARVRGGLAIVAAAAANGTKRILVPPGNAAEAAVVHGIDVYPVTTLSQAVRFLRGDCDLAVAGIPAAIPDEENRIDFSEVRGQDLAKRALEIAAAGGHNVLMSGPPGGGKTMLARRLPTILPPLDPDESMMVTRIYSVAGLLPEGRGLLTTRPFRSPHHSISIAGLAGGGSGMPMPGEISLAHAGVLFMDEAAEFRRDALQAMRQPIESGDIVLSRARYSVRYPSRFMLVLATNPCPCGFYGDYATSCECTPGRLNMYREKLSGPLLDRIDLQLTVGRVAKADLQSDTGEPSTAVRARVVAARQRQQERLERFNIRVNADIPPGALNVACALNEDSWHIVNGLQANQRLSMRGIHRVMRVARTVADLEGRSHVSPEHVSEAMTFRME